MRTCWTKFKQDPMFLTKYLGTHFTLLLIINTVLVFYAALDFHLDLSPTHLLLLPVAVLFGIQVPVLMHNCMHANLKSDFANTVLGEASAFFALIGLQVLRLNHALHHAFADTDEDPHAPSEMNFFKFFFIAQLSGASIIENKYLDIHGQTQKSRALFKLNIFLHFGCQLQCLALWYLILGPNFFLAFYLPAFLTYSLAFAHVNYITHQKDENGNMEIINKDDNLYYNFINFIGSGVYYHKNHHMQPRLLNPRLLNRSGAP